MRPANNAVPTYLSRLTGSAPARAPQLRPPRPLFPPAGALTGLEPQAPPAELGGPAERDHPRPGLGEPAPGHQSSAPETATDLPANRPNSGPPSAPAPELAAPDPRPTPSPPVAIPAVPAAASTPPIRPPRPGPAPSAMTENAVEPAAPVPVGYAAPHPQASPAPLPGNAARAYIIERRTHGRAVDSGRHCAEGHSLFPHSGTTSPAFP